MTRYSGASTHSVTQLAGALPCWLTSRQAGRIEPAVCLRIGLTIMPPEAGF